MNLAVALRLLVVLAILVAGGSARADAPIGYRCGPGGKALKGRGCACPRGKIDARDAGGNAICAPKPPPPPTACLAERKGPYTVKIDSQPNGATVYLGDKACGAVGTTPWTGKLAAGAVQVILERRSYVAVTRTLDVAKKRTQALVVPLVRTNLGTVDIRADSDPNVTGATVAIDGQPRGAAPLSLELPGGSHTVVLEKPGFEPFTQTITVEDAVTVTMLPSLKAVSVVTGRLVVEADVRGAEVFVDGKLAGTTPLSIELPARAYELEVKSGDLPPWKQSVTVGRGQALVRAVLRGNAPAKPTEGTLRVTTKAKGEVSIDGEVAGPTPLDKPLRPGDYWIVVRVPWHLPFEQRVTIEAGKTVDLAPALRPAVKLSITSTPPGAAVFVDGVRRGVTPLELDVALGEHALIVERAGYQRFTQQVKLVEGVPRVIDAVLKR